MRIGMSCTGCRSCEQICKKNAITMVESKTGFLEPRIDETKCVSCGMCKEACHLIERKGLSFRKQNLFVAGAKSKDDSQRYKSTSGGIFYLLASSFIKNGGAVYGVSFDKDFYVQHKRISSITEIEDLMGSKYVQSDTKHTFSEVENDLKKGTSVLYSGVPCQIAALQVFLATKCCDTSNLITVEVICHGAPSPLAWREYLSYAKKNICKTIHKIFFRHKIEGWHSRLKVRFLGSEKEDFKFQEGNLLIADDSFIKLFLKNLTLRDECHRCDYARRERTSDITLCDFWGIENTQAKSLDDDKGTSGVIIHSKKGIKLWNEISKDCDFIEVPYDIIAQNQQTMNVPFSRPEDKDIFWNDLIKNGWDSIKKYIDENTTIEESVKRRKKTIITDFFANLLLLLPVSRKKEDEYMYMLNDCRQRLIHIEDKVNSMKDYLIAMRKLDN